jgi:hypothetical protein
MAKKLTKKKCPTESQEQQKFIMQLRWLFSDLQFFAIPNGGQRNKSEARRLLLEGVEKGTPDIFIAEPRNNFHGLFIEMKRSIKSLSVISKEQKLKHIALQKKGYQVKIAYGCKDALTILNEYLL